MNIPELHCIKLPVITRYFNFLQFPLFISFSRDKLTQGILKHIYCVCPPISYKSIRN